MEKKIVSFEERISQLEQIVAQLEQGELSLEKSIQLYQDGKGIAKNCQAELNTAKLKIEELNIKKDDENNE